MSATMQGVDARAYLAGWLTGLVDMYTKDISALPADKWDATHGGCTRPASELTADAIALLDWTTDALKGNVRDDYGMDTIAAMKAKCSDPQAAAAQLASSADAFNSALAGASDEALNAMVTPPWKMDAPLYVIAQIAVSHIWYHDGQLNYIQALLGDGEVHWMDA